MFRGEEELLYTDDMPFAIKAFEHLKGKLETWKGGLELKGFRISVDKTRMMISEKLERLQEKASFLVLFAKKNCRQ